MNSKKRSPSQTATAFSMSKELFYAMERARAKLHMDRSNFIRYCIAKELAVLDATFRPAAFRPRKIAEKRAIYGTQSGSSRRARTPRKSKE